MSPTFVTFAIVRVPFSLVRFSLPYRSDVNRAISGDIAHFKFDGNFVPFLAKEGGSRSVFGSFYKLNENMLRDENIVPFLSFWCLPIPRLNLS